MQKELFQELLTIRAEKAAILAKEEKLKKKITAIVKLEGAKDANGHISISFDTLGSAVLQRSVSTTLKENAIDLIREFLPPDLCKRLIQTQEYIDTSALEELLEEYETAPDQFEDTNFTPLFASWLFNTEERHSFYVR